MLPGMPKPVITPRAVACVHVASDQSSATATSYSFTDKSLGLALPGRRIVVMVAARDVFGGVITGLEFLDVNGVSRPTTRRVYSNTGNGHPSIWTVDEEVLEGTTAQLIRPYSGNNMTNCSIDVFSLTSVKSIVPAATAEVNGSSDPVLNFASMPEGSVALALSTSYVTDATCTVTGAVESNEREIDTGSGTLNVCPAIGRTNSITFDWTNPSNSRAAGIVIR